MRTKRLFILVLIVGAILLIPFIAMQFTTEVNWTASDFIIMGILLLVTVLGIDLVLRKVSKTQNRLLISGIIFAVFFVIWAELAVGIFGSPFAGS
jgi:ABC-type cobalt transport system substrate-binding protein